MRFLFITCSLSMLPATSYWFRYLHHCDGQGSPRLWDSRCSKSRVIRDHLRFKPNPKPHPWTPEMIPEISSDSWCIIVVFVLEFFGGWFFLKYFVIPVSSFVIPSGLTVHQCHFSCSLRLRASNISSSSAPLNSAVRLRLSTCPALGFTDITLVQDPTHNACYFAFVS